MRLRFGSEALVSLAPRSHVRELLDRPVAEQLAGCGLRRLEQLVTGLVARARDESVNGQQQRHGSRAAARIRRR